MPTSLLPTWATVELAYPGPLAHGSKGPGVRRVQEWLTLRGHAIGVDEDFGPATLRALRAFAARSTNTGHAIDALTAALWADLVAPMRRAATERGSGTLAEAVAHVAKAHLKEHPREVGGANRGPWVRLYCKGQDGPAYAWCAGFVSYVTMQAATALGAASPLAYTLSCDTLAADAAAKGRFLAGAAVASGQIAPPALRGSEAAGVFLVRNPKNPKDWTHTGFALHFEPGSSRRGVATYRTVEGNTNTGGSREGYEVCARTRGMASVDFIRLSP